MPVKKEINNEKTENTEITNDSVENRYKKFTQIEHVLARPGMYVGDIATITSEQWILDTKQEKIISKFVTWNPGIYKIFDEIITNASDECQRSKSVKNIKVNFEGNTISVSNDGSGIPIQIHKEHNIYVPELIFCNLLSSSNYDDSKKRTTGGLNGLGAKLTNIYSTEFIVETVCNKQMYRQVFKNNMSEIGKPEITKTTEKDYTKITFTPDFAKFKLKDLDQEEHDTIEVLKKRVFDISAITPKTVSVYLNGEKIKCKDFAEYVSYYIGTKTESPRVYYEEPNGRWQVCIALSKKDSFQHVSFVNGISTIDGGSHIDHVILPIMKKCTEEIQAKHKNITVKPQYVKDSLFVFINSTIENPTFSSQTKDKHTTRVSEFGCKFTLTEDFTKKILKLGFVDSLLAVAEAKEKKSLSKTDGKKVVRLSIPKLDDANKAGTNESLKCTLILTEGDSAKTTAVSGLSVVGRDYFGVFPLRGKLLNTREASFSQISKNEEILNIKKILGLQTDTKTTKNLRYGKVLVMTDADYDGFHIKALLINFIDAGWPDLLKSVFIGSIITPIVKVSKGNERLSFYTHKEYTNWKETDQAKGNWHIKYYKGLGTSTAAEAREYFKNLKVLNYINKTTDDSNALVLAFKKTEADERKKWIQKNTEKFEGLDYNTKESVPVAQLINKELVLFSISDNVRSIPSIVDGLKPGQRKVLFACFKKKLKTEIKVAQLAGYISEHTSYHHGEHSLQETIINMAQNYVGANNMNLLQPCGQFGCVDPETDILLWDSTIKKAKDINVNDILIGDDGTKRIINKVVEGYDTMYKINYKKNNYIVNSQHILTLCYTPHKKIYWKNSSKSFYTSYFDEKTKKVKIITVRTIESTINNHYNSSKLSREEAYNIIQDKICNVNNNNIFDINIQDYLKLSKSDQINFYGIYNSKNIEWEEQSINIDPYILGSWLGDGYCDCHAIASFDSEIIKEWAIYLNKIGCELCHCKNNPPHENHTFYIRRRGSSKNNNLAIGDESNSCDKCIGCNTSKYNCDACNWSFDKNIDDFMCNGLNINNCKAVNLNPFKELFKNNNLYKNKHIPTEYIYNSKENRLKLLAGLIDTDGTLKKRGNTYAYEFSQCYKRKNIIESIKIICGSLGYVTSIYDNKSSKILTISITGNNINEIPVKVERKKIKNVVINNEAYLYKINVQMLENNKYCGWYIDKNERFLLSDFTITHNTRLMGGKDSSSPRYIFTHLSNYSNELFNLQDFPLLEYLNDDGQSIEPKFYVPTLPLLLINGAEGIGTGFSTKIPSFNPDDLKFCLEKLVEDPDYEIPELTPWYRGFNGHIEKIETNKWISYGSYIITDNMIKITEIPIGESIENYKQFLEKMEADDRIITFKNNSTDTKVNFEIKMRKETLNQWEYAGTLEKNLKLTSNINATNMYIFNEKGNLQKMDSPEDILLSFFRIRNKYHILRKEYLTEQISKELVILQSKVKFVRAIVNDELVVFKRKKQQITEDIKKMGLYENPNYDYLLNMPIHTFTEETIDKLEKEYSSKENEYEVIKNTTIKDLWNHDFDKIN